MEVGRGKLKQSNQTRESSIWGFAHEQDGLSRRSKWRGRSFIFDDDVLLPDARRSPTAAQTLQRLNERAFVRPRDLVLPLCHFRLMHLNRHILTQIDPAMRWRS